VGYVVVMPDSQAMPDSHGLKGRHPPKNIDDISMTNWCGGFNAWDGTCSGFNKPYCYTTKKANILHQQEKYRKYVNRLYEVRKSELDYFVAAEAELLDSAAKVFLMGTSEGGMVVNRYYNKNLDDRLSGTIIDSFSCEFNYFYPCADAARRCEHKCKKTVPQLNMIGDIDEYFGAQDGSTARDIADSADGYGDPSTGNCKAAYDAYGFTTAVVVSFNDAGHGPMYWNDNIARSVLTEFVADPAKDTSEWTSLKSPNCEKDESGIFQCGFDGPQTCDLDNWVLSSNATWNFKGTQKTCTAGTDDTSMTVGCKFSALVGGMVLLMVQMI